MLLVEGHVYFYQGGVMPGKNEPRLVDLSHWDRRISRLAFYMIPIGDFVLVLAAYMIRIGDLVLVFGKME